MAETNLRQAESKVTVRGILSEKSLEQKHEDGDDIISGKLVVQTSDINFITFPIYQKKTTKSGKTNPAYKSLETVLHEYHSVAEVGRDEATHVDIHSGQFAPYTNKQTGRSNSGIRASFFSRIEAGTYEPCADIELEVFITGVTPETYKYGDSAGEETGSALIKGWFPTYNGIEPVECVAPVEDGVADAFLGADYKYGDTVKLFGEIVNTRVEKTREIPVKIGKPKIEREVSYVNEIVVTGATEAYDADNGDDPFSTDAVNSAVKEREIELESGSNTDVRKASVGASNGRKLPSF